MDARTRLAFFILKTHAGWLVRVDGFVYPPCTTQADAFAKAIREAKAAERLSFASAVLAQSVAGEPCTVRWSCAGAAGVPRVATETPHSAIPPMAGIPPSAHRSEERP